MDTHEKLRAAMKSLNFGLAAALDRQLVDEESHGRDKWSRRPPRTADQLATEQIREFETERKTEYHKAMNSRGHDHNPAMTRVKEIEGRIHLIRTMQQQWAAGEAEQKDIAAAKAAEEARAKARGSIPDFRASASVSNEQRLALKQQHLAMAAADPCAAVLFAEKYSEVLFSPETTAVYEAWRDGPAPPQGAAGT